MSFTSGKSVAAPLTVSLPRSFGVDSWACPEDARSEYNASARIRNSVGARRTFKIVALPGVVEWGRRARTPGISTVNVRADLLLRERRKRAARALPASGLPAAVRRKNRSGRR